MIVFAALLPRMELCSVENIDRGMRILLNSLFVIFLWSAAGICVVSCIGEDESRQQVELVQVGDRVPEFEVLLSDGRTFSTKTLGDDVKVIVFFDTECADCQKFLPVYQSFVDELRVQDNKMEGVTVRCCALARDESAVTVRTYWNKYDLTLPYYASGNRVLYYRFARAVVPRVYIVNSRGVVTAKLTDNPVPTLEVLRRVVKAAALQK